MDKRAFEIYAGRYSEMKDYPEPYAFVSGLGVIREIGNLILNGKGIDYITVKFGNESIHFDIGNLKSDMEDLMGWASNSREPYPEMCFEIRNPFYDEKKDWDLTECELVKRSRGWGI